ncbi:adenosine deaminase [Thalassotalea sp. M1531]|uniref:adenosine deaminase n=1 Tax=Thalassotalea algicola TaxID=2716224 RepID=A0A7Y0LBL4_9GAMM|nr:adenosine deaminase [Thalassotalea algicola]NMP31560.1 adenosine deaminase [Thalassotalea algicola]
MYNSALPLIDLHRHLDGNIRPQTIWDLANQNNIKLPASNLEELMPHVQIQKNEPDLLSFLAKLDWGVKVLKTLDDVKRVAYENVEDAFNAGLSYAELRFSPFYMAMNHQLPVSDVVAAIVDGVNAGQQQYAIKINLLGILSRTFGVKHCTTELNAILDHKNHITGIDLAGDEINYPCTMFVDLFKKARDENMRITVHAGEAMGPDSVWQAINMLGAERIGHGVNSYQDQDLLDHMVRYNIGLESCLTSNFQTGTVKDLAQHPITKFLENGNLVCLNTDDPAVEGIEIKDEFKLAKQLFNFSEKDFTVLQENAINMAFLSDSEKQTLRSIKTNEN